jgi:hypothetical protein
MTTLRCEYTADCPGAVTHIDNKGFIYCQRHGQIRRESRHGGCRKLRPHELRRLERGEKVKSY